MASPLTTSGPARILAVDDGPENLKLIRLSLESEGYAVLTASSGAQALEAVARETPSLILLDLLMPGMDGYEVCARLKADKSCADIPVLFISAQDDSASETRGLAMGAADFISKPISVPVLRARVRTHLALSAQRRSLEGMFRDVIEFAPDAFILADAEGRIVQINAETERLFGYARAELKGQPVELLLPGRLRAAHLAHRESYTLERGGLRMGSAARCMRKDGSEFPADISLTPLQTNRGPLLMAVVRDVSERRRYEERLQESVRYARSLIEANPDPMVVIDTHGIITDVNEAGELLTGMSRGQLIGSEAAGRFTEPERLYQGYLLVLERGQVSDYPMTVRHASGRIVEVMCNARAFRDAQGRVTGVFASARDVTESRRIQAEITASRQRLRELAAQSEAVREYERKSIAREVHDELGQVLTALRMDLTFLDLRHGAATPELHDKLLEMRTLVDRAIQGVRNVAKNLRPTALDMGLIPAVEWLCGEFSRHNGIPCAFVSQVEGVELVEDRAIGVFRIVQESLTNVSRYAQAQKVEISLRLAGDALELRVHDNGRGFDPEQVSKGRSFGLLGMQERALALGGTLEVVSASGQGTQVRMTVPLHHISQWQGVS